MTRADVPADDEIAIGIRPLMICISVGIEHPEDVIADLRQALDEVLTCDRARRVHWGAMSSQPEVWLRGPVSGIPSLLQPVAHALLQAGEDVARLTRSIAPDRLWTRPGGAASAGFHLLHLAGSLDRLFTYARGEALDEAQKAALRMEGEDHPDLDAAALGQRVAAAIDRALVQLRATPVDSLFDARAIGRAALPSTVLGLLFHAAEHTTRHVGQCITTVKVQG